MAFEADLRGYLSELDHELRPVVRAIDEGQLRRHFLARLDAEAVQEGLVQWLALAHGTWSPRLARLTDYLRRLPPGVAPVDDEAAQAFAHGIVDRATAYDDIIEVNALPSRRLERQRIVEEFIAQLAVEMYARENRLVIETDAARPTALGRAFLRLWGRDAIRWLLAVEVAQSRGPSDPWRTSREILATALHESGIEHVEETVGARLRSFGVLRKVRGKDATTRYVIEDAMRDVVHDVLRTSSWTAAVNALIADERGIELPHSPATSSAIEAASEQSKLITHEVRNALVPVRHHIDALLESPSLADRKRVEAARRGVVRVLTFVEEMVSVNEVVTEPATTFGALDVVRTAIGWIDGADRVEVVERTPAQLRAPRSRLTRAISNVIGNALQNTRPPQPIRVSIAREGHATRIEVDDGGEGVPAAMREQIFRDGVTTRADGTGYGLAFVRRVAVDQLRGRVWCEASDLGGARFVIEIPDNDP